jgi:bifunctional non-homologous end joining protein LigD
VRLTSLDRVLWPRTGFTKGDLLDYYLAVAPILLPHLADRPLTLGRWPLGVEGRGFAQTECRGRPGWLPTMPLRLRSGEVRNYCLVRDVPSLAWVANLGAIELHTYQFRAGRPDEPIALVLDLDPGPGIGLREACRVALLLRERIEEEGMRACVKTSGGLGMHVFVPLGAPQPGTLASERPDLVTADQRPRERRRRVLVDWLQNEPRRSTVAPPYSLRATDVPRVSTPVDWSEVETAAEEGDAAGLRFSPAEALARVQRRGDLFAPVLATGPPPRPVSPDA